MLAHIRPLLSLDIDISHWTPTVEPGTSCRRRELGLTFSPMGGLEGRWDSPWGYGIFPRDYKQCKQLKTCNWYKLCTFPSIFKYYIR
jgi:hypothetical protein